jgi:HAD superfamily hydrolase (TIGR01549 family)
MYASTTMSSTIRAVDTIVFDAFGTLCRIANRRGPFVKLARRHLNPRATLQAVMTQSISLRDMADDVMLDRESLATLENDLNVELESLQLYPDVLQVLRELRDNGFRLGIASNLAAPYAEPLIRLLPFTLDVCAWSFKLGRLKPDSYVFDWICESLNVPPQRVLMIGDTFSADYTGATAIGMQAVHLDRRGISTLPIPTIRTLKELLPLLGN